MRMHKHMHECAHTHCKQLHARTRTHEHMRTHACEHMHSTDISADKPHTHTHTHTHMQQHSCHTTASIPPQRHAQHMEASGSRQI